MAFLAGSEKCTRCRIPDSCPFAGIPGLVSQVRPLLESRYYGNECAIFRQNQKAAGVFIIQSGWVALSAYRSGGKRVPIGLRGPGSVLGLPESIDSSVYLATAETGDETELEFLSGPDLLMILEQSGPLRTQLLKLVARQTREIINDLFDVAGRIPADQRLSRTLLELASTSGHQSPDDPELRLRITVQDLSAQIGCSRQWTSTLLTELERKGVVRRRDGWIILRRDVGPTAKRKYSRRATGASL